MCEHDENAWVIFYDGECGFCNNWVKFYFQHRRVDSDRTCFFSPLQSDYCHQLLEKPPEQYKSIVFYKDGNIHTKSSAVIHIMKNLSFKYRVLANMMWLVPVCIRNWVYDIVAENREGLSSPYCYVPTKEEKLLFID